MTDATAPQLLHSNQHQAVTYQQFIAATRQLKTLKRVRNTKVNKDAPKVC